LTIRVRFAPSPTGHLHVGGARTAIFNWLFARRHGGTFIIRVEDTDQARSTRESEAMVLEDLRWLGMTWEEGPDAGGPHAPYRQSERVDFYSAAAQQLLASGVAYRCFCTEEELEAKRKKAEEEGRPPHYDLTCFRLAPQQISAKLAMWTPFALRFHVPDTDDGRGDVTIHDLIRREVTWRRESLGDFILVRSDGLPTYNFSVVVDDHEMEITHVIRAEEHLTNTHRQVLIYRAMSWEVPQFAHVSLILGPDRSKLSKRHGATSVTAYAEEGFLPEAMVNFLAMLGWSTPDGREIFPPEYAFEHFSLDRVNAAAAVFDRTKLEWMNGQYIHAMTAAELRPLVAKFFDAPWLEEGIDVVKTSVHLLTQFADALRFVKHFDPVAVAQKVDPVLYSAIEILAAFIREHGAPTDEASYKLFVEEMKRLLGLKGRPLFHLLRLVLTGEESGPELVRALPLIQYASNVDDDVWSPADRAEEVASEVNDLLSSS
jgi:nondiscriminating glutamyl-tRNA synthetase